MEHLNRPLKSTFMVIRKCTDMWEAQVFGRNFVGSWDACARWVNVQLAEMRKDARLRRGITVREIESENRAQGV